MHLFSRSTGEDDLILACARTDADAQRIEELARRGLDWDALLRKIEASALAPLAWTNLRQVVRSGQMPQPAAERLRHLSHRDTVHGIERRELLRLVLAQLSEAGIPVVALEETTLATLVYASPALRPMRNIDLLVHQRDTDLINGALSIPPERANLLDIRQQVFGASLVGDGHFATRVIPIREFWERTQAVHIESVPVLVLSPEDLLLTVAFRLALATGFVGQLRTLCDVGELCRRHAGALDWSQVVSRADRYGIAKPLYHALSLARQMVGADVSSEVLAELRTTFGQLPLEERLIAALARRAILGHRIPRPWKAYRIGLCLLASKNASDGMATAYRFLTGPSEARLRALGSNPSPQRKGSSRAGLPAAAIVLPIYRPRVRGEELAAVDRAVAILRHGDWYLIAPQSLDTSFYEHRYGIPIVRFPDACFESVRTYSRLLLTDEFYAAFARYDYMLVVQDDVYVLHDDLPHWLSRGFDYIGAPWPDGFLYGLNMSRRPGIYRHQHLAYVGNGGFSLRRVDACRRLLAEFPEELASYSEGGAEDMFFAMFGQFSRSFVLPNLRTAAAFAWETSLPRMYDLCEGQLPMAIHGYLRNDADFFRQTVLPAASSADSAARTVAGERRQALGMRQPIARTGKAPVVDVDAQLAFLHSRLNAIADLHEDHEHRARVDARLSHLKERLDGVSEYLLALPNPAASAPIVAKRPIVLGAVEDICLFVSFAPAPALKPHVRDHISALVDHGIAVVLIVNTSHSADDVTIDADLVNRLSGCVIRANTGFDFAAWAHAYSLLEIPRTCKRLYMVNDSLVGPLQPEAYERMIGRIRRSTADMVGLTERSQPSPHLQSSFLVITERLLRSETFARLMRGIVNMPTKEGVILQYETQITRFLRAQGFSCEAMFPPLSEGEDDTYHHWAPLIEQGYPFVRARVLDWARDTPDAERLIPERFLAAPR